MSLLIRGVQYPRSSPLTLIIYPDGTVSSVYDNQRGTAVPVPPHGRLIDADALEDDDPDVCNSFMRDGYVESCEWGYSHEQIRNAPTIIPASEEGET